MENLGRTDVLKKLVNLSEAEATDFLLAVSNEDKDTLGARELSVMHELEEDKFCARELSAMEGRDTLNEWQPELNALETVNKFASGFFFSDGKKERIFDWKKNSFCRLHFSIGCKEEELPENCFFFKHPFTFTSKNQWNEIG